MKSNSKLVQTFLIIVVIGIWGLIGYRVYNAMGEDVEVLPSMYIPKSVEVDSMEVKLVELDLDYNNPFTGAAPPRAKRTISSKSKSKEQNVVLPEPIVQPNLIYKGYSYNDVGERRIALSLDSKMHYVKVGERLNDITVLNASKSELVVSYKGKIYRYER